MNPNPVTSLLRLKHRTVGLALAGALALPLLAAVPAHARYEVPVAEGPCPRGSVLVVVDDPRLPGHPWYCRAA